MRAQEFIIELRDRMYQYIQSIVPTWPEYIVKDWLYANQAKPFGRQSNITPADRSFETLRTFIPELLADIGLTVDTKWQLVPNMKFTMDMWEPKTKQRLIARAGGKPTELVPSTMAPNMKDAERHTTQAALAKQQGGIRKEPVILLKTSQGYELLEGWHRTIQHFAAYPDGYTGPAYVAVAQSPQGVAEAFDQPYAFHWDNNDDLDPDLDRRYDALARLPDGTNLTINFYTDSNYADNEDWMVEFWRGNRLDISGAGDAQRVFATVLTAIGQFIEMEQPETLRFTADKDVEPGQKAMSRSNLYDRLVQRYAQAWGYKLDRSDMANTTIYQLYRIR